MPSTPRRPATPAMSSAHKAALARGRREGHAVRRYLEAVDAHRPKPGRRRTPESIRRRLASVDGQLGSAAPLRRLHLLQEKADLEHELARQSDQANMAALEQAFVAVARAYGERKGIGYDAWRAAGVSPAVLERAGITRARKAPGVGRASAGRVSAGRAASGRGGH